MLETEKKFNSPGEIPPVFETGKKVGSHEKASSHEEVPPVPETGNNFDSPEQERIWEVNTYENEKGRWNVYPGLCKGCGLCIEKCPVSVIEWSKELGFMGTPTVKPEIKGCIVCGVCQTICPDSAIHVERKGRGAPPSAVPVH